METASISEELLETSRWFAIDKSVKEFRIADAVKRLRVGGIEPILLKGWTVARYYPESHPRQYNDIDLAISPDDFDLGDFRGYLPATVDVHRGLRHLDTVGWEDLFANSELVKIHEADVRILRPEDQLRAVCVHWLTDGGAYKHRLWDVYYSVLNRPANFDWDRCIGVVSADRRKWIITTIAIAHRYLGLEVDDLPFAEEARNVPAWIVRCLEREWASDERLVPVISVTNEPRKFFRQVLTRIPPNPIRATVECEGSFDDRFRLRFQLRVLSQLTIKGLRSLPALLTGLSKHGGHIRTKADPRR